MGVCDVLDNCISWKHRRWVAVIIAVVDLLFFSGYYYGFNALVPAYKHIGVFNDSCIKPDCLEQNKMFGISFTVWVVVQMCFIPFVGFFMDKVGLRATKLVAVTVFALGTLLFAFTSHSTSALFFVAGILTAIGGTSTLICNFQCSSMFQSRRGTVVAILSGAFDASTFITYIISAMHPAFQLKYSFIILACVAIVVGWLFGVFFLTKRSSDMVIYDEGKELADDSAKCMSEYIDVANRVEQIMNQRYPSIRSCILSWPFALVTFWFAFGLLRFSYFLGHLSENILEMFPDDSDLREQLGNNSSLVLMCGALVAPITAVILDYFQNRSRMRIKQEIIDTNAVDEVKIYWYHLNGLAPAFLIMALDAIAFSLLLFIKHEASLYLAIGLFTLFRSLLFSASVNFCLTAFPLRYFGTVNGVANMVGGLWSLIQHAMVGLTPVIGNVLALVYAVCLILPPVVIFWKARN